MFRNKISIIVMSLSIIFLLSSCIMHTTNAKKATISANPAQAIEGGTPYQDQNNPPSWIGALYKKGTDNPTCTIEFIPPKYALTALHCIIEDKDTLDDFSVQYRARSNGRLYPKVGVKSYTTYKDGYDIVLLELKKNYPGPIQIIPFYHGYIFNKYDKYNKANIKRYGYGALQLNPEEENKNSILKELTGNKVLRTYLNSTILVTTLSGGIMLGGDSGGPVLITNLVKDKLIGIFLSSPDQNDASSNDILITMDILEWISNITGVPIFNNIIENQYILAPKDNIIPVSGWGNMPSNAKIVIYSSNGEYTDEVASCNNFTHSTDNQWHCNIQFPINYDYSKHENYKVSIISIGEEMDYVYFKLYTSAQNIKILHPFKHTDGSNVWFTYHTPVGESYLITGTATPGTYLTYNLTDVTTNLSDEYPCINSGAMESVPDSGIWRCRIMVQDPESKTYDFTVGLDRSREPLPDNRKRPLDPSVDTVQYKVEPMQQKLSLDIVAPLNNDKFLYPYEITADIEHGKVPIKLTSTITIGDDYYEHRTVDMINDSIYHSGPIEDSNEYGLAHLVLSLYLDDDEYPIVTESVNYFIKNEFIAFTMPRAGDKLIQGNRIFPCGTAVDTSDITDIDSIPPLIAKIYAFKVNSNNKHYICKAIIKHGKWRCDTDGDINLADLTQGKYILVAYLAYGNDEDKFYTSDKIGIEVTSEVKFKTPLSP